MPGWASKFPGSMAVSHLRYLCTEPSGLAQLIVVELFLLEARTATASRTGEPALLDVFVLIVVVIDKRTCAPTPRAVIAQDIVNVVFIRFVVVVASARS